MTVATRVKPDAVNAREKTPTETPALWFETVPARWSGSPYLTWNFDTLSVTAGCRR